MTKHRPNRWQWIVLGLLLLGLTACARRVTRIGPEEPIDLSGRWNDTDSRLVAETMVRDALERPWTHVFRERAGRQPVVIVGTVLNRSHEHINTQTFIKDLERELTNSGQVRFVADAGQRQEIRLERRDQASHASDATAKRPGEEFGADFMLKGTINTIVDELANTRVVFYQVDLEIIDIEKNLKVWIGQKKIKKLIERSRAKF